MMNHLVKNLEESATEIVDNEIKKMRRNGITDIVSLGVGEPFFDTPEVIKEAAKKALDSGKTKYQPTFGDYELREAIQQKFIQKNHIKSHVDEIMVTPGAKFAIYIALQAILEPKDKVIILDPCWVSHSSIALLMGAELIRIPTIEDEGYQPDIEAISRAFASKIKCMIINSPCNPTGAVYPREPFHKIMEMAEKAGIIVLSDEIYESLIYGGEHYSPASEFSNVITVNGFSKSYAMTGWRLGYATGPKYLMEEMNKIYQHSASCVTAFAQAGALEALTNPRAAQAADEMVAQFRRNRQIITEYLENSPYFSCTPPMGAFYCFAKYFHPVKSVDLARDLLAKSHLATVPGIAFGECGEFHLRLSYASSEPDLIEGLNRLDKYFQKMNRGSGL
jgi:aspartate aminotransferase